MTTLHTEWNARRVTLYDLSIIHTRVQNAKYLDLIIIDFKTSARMRVTGRLYSQAVAALRNILNGELDSIHAAGKLKVTTVRNKCQIIIDKSYIDKRNILDRVLICHL